MLTMCHDLEEKNSLFNIPGTSESLYCCFYRLSKQKSNTGILIIPPIGQERHWFYREMVILARDIAQTGIPVARFDYRGEGESSGDFKESSIISRVEDIAYAAQALKENSGIDLIYLIGFRLGAVLSLLAAQKIGCSHLIACEPVFDTKMYAGNLIKTNMVMQQYYFSKVTRNEKALREILVSGNTISVYGFSMHKNIIDELEAIDVASHLANYKGVSSVVYFSATGASPKPEAARWYELLNKKGKSYLLCAKDDFEWRAKFSWKPRLESLNQQIVNCVRTNAS